MTKTLTKTSARAERVIERAAELDVSYRRGGGSNLVAYAEGKPTVPQPALYTKAQAANLIQLNVEKRMKVKISDHYNQLVNGRDGAPPSTALANLVTARGEEVADLSGEVDPSNQLKFSPIPGLLHKYDMALVYVALTCSAHCRYCYRSDLFSGVSGKSLAKPEEVAGYILEHNWACEAGGGFHPKTGRPPLKEVLLSGGDPMVLGNKKLARWLCTLAESGIRNIRIGTKELAFFPQRFDEHLASFLDAFHEAYPEVRLVFVCHFTHPDEFLVRDQQGAYVEHRVGHTWLPEVQDAIAMLQSRGHFVSLCNQTPIIRSVNDDADALRLLQRELYRKGVQSHYFFQCRPIQGHQAFTLPVEHTWKLFQASKQHLSGVESTARLVMSTERGKTEICGITGDGSNQIVFRLLRSPGAGDGLGDLAIARRNTDAHWINDYADRVVSDPAGIVLETLAAAAE